MMKYLEVLGLILVIATIYVIGTMLVVNQTVNAQKYDEPPPPVIPQARAEICGNTVVEAQALAEVAGILHADGCKALRIEPLHNGYWLVFGTKVIVGEFP